MLYNIHMYMYKKKIFFKAYKVINTTDVCFNAFIIFIKKNLTYNLNLFINKFLQVSTTLHQELR